MIKRIVKEVELLNTRYIVDNCFHFDKSVNIYLNTNFVVKFILNDYPFSRPKVYIIYNTIQTNYNDFTHLKYPRLQRQLDLCNKRCFCGSTIMCRDWKPSYKITDIIDDIKNMRNLIRNLIYNSYIDKICEKNHIPDDIAKLIYFEK